MHILTHVCSGLADGSYMYSCENINASNLGGGFSQLDAACRQTNGAYNATSLIVPPNYDGEISNCDGILYLGFCQ